MRLYELLYIIPATFTDEEVGKIEQEALALVKKYGGDPKESRRLGKFKLAYLIKRIRHGHYVLINFESEPDAVAKINEAFRIFENSLRHLIIRAEEGGDEFNLVQFQEIVVDGSYKNDRKKTIKKVEVKDIKEDAEKLDHDKQDSKDKDVETSTKEDLNSEEKVIDTLSEEELEKKISDALTEEA